MRRNAGSKSEETLVVDTTSGQVELRRQRALITKRGIKLHPTIVTRTEKSMPYQQFWTSIVEATRRSVNDAFRRLLEKAYRLNPQQDRLVRLINGFLTGVSQRFVKDEARRVKARQAGPDNAEALKVLQRVTEENVHRFSADLPQLIAEKLKGRIQAKRQEMIERFTATMPDDKAMPSYVLPPGTRFFMSSGTTSVVAIEQPPQMRTLYFDETFTRQERYHHDQGYEARRYRLSFPYVVYLFTFVDKRMADIKFYYRNTPLESIDDPLMACNLPNTIRTGQVCYSGFHFEGKSEAVVAHEWISQFWGSPFNDHWCDEYRRAASTNDQLADIKRWEKESKDNPLFILKMRWNPTNYTLRSAMNAMLQEKVHPQAAAQNKWQSLNQQWRVDIEKFVDEAATVAGEACRLMTKQNLYEPVIVNAFATACQAWLERAMSAFEQQPLQLTAAEQEQLAAQLQEAWQQIIHDMWDTLESKGARIELPPPMSPQELLKLVKGGK